jgi:hypothetical protein
MTKIRHTIDGYDVDWISGGNAEEAISFTRKKEKLREDISRIDKMMVDDLNDLDDRVFQALSKTRASIEAFRQKSQYHTPDDEDLDWFRRAEYSRNYFCRVRKLIHRRKVTLNYQEPIRAQISKKDAGRLQAAREQELALKKQQEKTRREELKAENVRVVAEAKTRRHQLAMETNLSVAKKVISLIRDRGIMTAEEISQLYEEARAIVSEKISKEGDANG